MSFLQNRSRPQGLRPSSFRILITACIDRACVPASTHAGLCHFPLQHRSRPASELTHLDLAPRPLRPQFGLGLTDPFWTTSPRPSPTELPHSPSSSYHPPKICCNLCNHAKKSHFGPPALGPHPLDSPTPHHPPTTHLKYVVICKKFEF